MAGVASGRSGDSSGQESSATGEALAEWRSSEQLENGTPSTSPPYWETDEDDCGLRPSELYGKHTWKIDKFSQINKRELRSSAFEVGGYKWYILIYPQGCDVCNHLSLFLCVANHDKLLPGWSHFAQFTIAVVNKDPKKSKYSDTLHRFWKKEHDWGWKKFMELSKVLDGFIDNDTLIIKAQVQVIREKADRPFRCLDCQYRRELVRVYLTNVEQICRKFVEERRSKLVKLIEDKTKWLSFCGFWLAIDQKSRQNMARERTDTILRIVVKQFFIEKEVTSTLVMDSLYSGLKAIEDRTKTNEFPIPVVGVVQDMFVLVNDVLPLVERAAFEPLPPKDDKGPQNRMKDGSSGDDSSKESIERDERRLTELGRSTIEIFVLAHIFSKIEGAYQEAVALKRQEELIREEEAWLETEHRSKRSAAEKDKKSKKKQGKQKRKNRKGKEKARDDVVIVEALDKLQLENPEKSKDSTQPEEEKPELSEEVSDASDTVENANEALNLDSEERESSPVDVSVLQNGEKEINGPIAIDDSSSTCSTDSVPSVIMNGSHNQVPNQEWHRSPTRNQRGRAASEMSGRVNKVNVRSSDIRRDVGPQNGSSGSRKVESEPEASKKSSNSQINKIEQRVVKAPTVSNRAETSIKAQADTQKPPAEKTTIPPSSPISSSKTTPQIHPKPEPKTITAPLAAKISTKNTPTTNSPVGNLTFSKPIGNPIEAPVMSRPLSAPIGPGPRPSAAPIASMVQSQPLLSRSVSAVGRLGPDPAPRHHHQSYRNAMMGTTTQPSNTGLYLSQQYTTPAQSVYQPMFGMVNTPPMRNDAHAPDLFKQVRSSPRSNGGLIDEFPHLDIINDILDDEYEPTSTSFRDFDDVGPYLNRQFSYPGDLNAANSMLAGTSGGSARFDRSFSYQENGFQGGYFPEQNLRSFQNGQIDGLGPSQWQMEGPDFSYPYHVPEYSNFAGNSNGYHVFRPPNRQ